MLKVGEKIKLLREARGIARDDLVLAIDLIKDITTNKISFIEKGVGQFSEEELELVKECLDVTGLPLTEHECAAIEERLYVLRSLVRGRQFSEAKIIVNELADLVKLEVCDTELPMLYRLFEIHFLLFTDKLDIAEEKLNDLQGRLDEMNFKHRYFYNCNMGILIVSLSSGLRKQVLKLLLCP